MTMDLARWRVAVEADWRVLEAAPKELRAEKEAPVGLVGLVGFFGSDFCERLFHFCAFLVVLEGF